MSSSAPVKHKAQGGIALIVLVMVIAFTAIAYALGSISIESLRYEQSHTSYSALKRAKQALLDYAVTYEDSNPGEYGFLPCPDYRDDATAEGGSDGNCEGAKENILGLFPWASLETGILKSGTGQCLWYAVSGEYKSSPKTNMLNADTNGAMRLFHDNGNIKQGVLAEDRIVAILFDPSNVLPGQNRSFDNTSQCGLDYSAAGYLEGDGVFDNAMLSGGELAIDDYISSSVVNGVATAELATPYNDSLVTISRNELWDAVLSRRDITTNTDSTMRRMTEALALCIAAYGNNSGNRKLPRPSAVDFGGADYRRDTNYDDTAAVSYLGRYPRTVDDSDATLGALFAPNDAEEVLFNKGYCDAIIPAVSGGPAINLNTVTQLEGYTLWKNWKDHFFYAVSAYYAPDNSADTGVPSCGGTNCISVGANEYAAVVLFSGRRTGAQLRNEPVAGDTDTKNSLLNYIEVNNPVGNGTGNYTPNVNANDIAFCVTDTDPLTVVSCP